LIDEEEIGQAALKIQQLHRKRRARKSYVPSHRQSTVGSERQPHRMSLFSSSQRHPSVYPSSHHPSVVSAQSSDFISGRVPSLCGPSHDSSLGAMRRQRTVDFKVVPISMTPPGSPRKETPQGPSQPLPDAIRAIYLVLAVLVAEGRWKIWSKHQQPRKSIRSAYRRLCSSVLFWWIWPWVASQGLLALMTFLAFIYMMKFFAFNNDLMRMWMQTVFTSVGLTWFVTLPAVIIVRNNLKFTKKVMKSKEYQVIEKFVFVPLGKVVGTLFKALRGVAII